MGPLYFFNEELPVTQKWPSKIDNNLSIIKIDELIALIKEIDDTIKFEAGKGWRSSGGYKYETTVHYFNKKIDKVKLRIVLSNRLGEDQFEHGKVLIYFPKGDFELHEERINSLYEKYISGLVNQLVDDPEKVKKIISTKHIYADNFGSMENASNPNHYTFFNNYAYSVYQEDGPYSDDPVEEIALIFRIVDMYNRGGK